MPAAYDSYDYPRYWTSRDYEHLSETIALKTFLAEIPKITTILDIGAGYGRLTPYYSFRAKKIILTEPSAKLLSIARKNLAAKHNIIYIQTTWENIHTKLRANSVDLIVMIRVLHHIRNLGQVLATIHKLLKPGGYFILEFANKSHLKATLKELSKGNLTYIMDISAKDISSPKSIKQNKLPMINYHPDTISMELAAADFQIKDRLSVSNIRSPFIKKILPVSTLIGIEKQLQKPLAPLNFGPSIFVLAQKG